jgi:hypothetical protein
LDIGTGCKEGGFLGAAEPEQVQGAFEQLLDFGFGGELWGEQFVQIEFGETSARYESRQQSAKLSRTDVTSSQNFFKDNSSQRVKKIIRLQKATDFQAGSGFYEDGTKQPQGVALHAFAIRRIEKGLRFHVMRR